MHRFTAVTTELRLLQQADRPAPTDYRGDLAVRTSSTRRAPPAAAESPGPLAARTGDPFVSGGESAHWF